MKNLKNLFTLSALRGKQLPVHIRWSFGEKKFAFPKIGNAAEFKYWFDPIISPIEVTPFRAEVIQACKRIDAMRKGRKIALCYSAGIDSEAIALGLIELNIPFELYFLDIWGLNRKNFDIYSQPFLEKHQRNVNIVQLNRTYFYDEWAPSVFSEFGIENPTYLAMPYLFERIPRDQFIVVGDGDLDRTGRLYKKIGEKFPGPTSDGEIVLPYSYASIFYYLWSKKRKRDGEFYFFSSTPGLISSMVKHPNFQYSYPKSSTREVMYTEFPEIAPRPKTTNWDGGAYHENIWIRDWLKHNEKTEAKFKRVSGTIGTIVNINSIFR